MDGHYVIQERCMVLEECDDTRLDQFAAKNFRSLPSRKSALKAAKRGELLLNGDTAEPSRFLHKGDELILLLPTTCPPIFPLSLDVVWEDAWGAVVSKPPGIPVNGNYFRTVERALPYNLQESTALDTLAYPKPVHRLDSPTGGLLLVAKCAKALMNLNSQFEAHTIKKRYRAIVTGLLEGEKTISTPVNGKNAETIYRAIDPSRSLRTGWITTVDLKPITGRTHQLRKHMADLGHPIVGDVAYGAKSQTFRGKGLFLWAVELEFDHPQSGKRVILRIDEPPKFQSYRQREERRWKKYNL